MSLAVNIMADLMVKFISVILSVAVVVRFHAGALEQLTAAL